MLVTHKNMDINFDMTIKNLTGIFYNLHTFNRGKKVLTRRDMETEVWEGVGGQASTKCGRDTETGIDTEHEGYKDGHQCSA